MEFNQNLIYYNAILLALRTSHSYYKNFLAIDCATTSVFAYNFLIERQTISSKEKKGFMKITKNFHRQRKTLQSFASNSILILIERVNLTKIEIRTGYDLITRTEIYANE